MGKGIHQVDVHASQSSVWAFIRDLNAWATLVPGYREHTILSDRESHWKFVLHYGVVTKKMHVQVWITEWIVPSEVKFTLTGINQRFTGTGYFKADETSPLVIRMTGCLMIESTSPLAKLLQTTFDHKIIDLTKELTTAVGEAIERKES
ncbi:SRPBCC family protein [Bacillus sp. NTK074B]|uniref:CoxG family protein n=1 Tax=Bacillus sp. NTK074B TaxID=2802174 RepID=UPI001A8D9601|nr:SRPBCC family protein [Bacillus sp. NTK074B]